MAGHWPISFFLCVCFWTETELRAINTQNKELGQYPAFDRTTLKDFTARIFQSRSAQNRDT